MGGGSYRNDVYRSTDGGATWLEVTASAAWSARNLSNSVVLPDGSIVLIGGRDGDGVKKDVWRSVDGGATWIQMADNAQWSSESVSKSAVALADGSIILMDSVDGVWRGTNGGATWEQISVSSEGFPRAYQSSVVLPNGSIVSMGGLLGSRRRDVWRLVTAGSTGQNPAHTYTKPGIYPVTLYAYNEYSFSIEQKAAYISVEGAQYTINVSAHPAEGGTVEGGGTYTSDSEVTVTAIPNENFNFINWTEDGTAVSTDSNYTFTATSDRNLIANFALDQYQVILSAVPAAGGTVTGDGTYSHGSEVTLSATPATGYYFINWEEDDLAVSTDPNYTFTIYSDRTFIANFALMEYVISVSADPVNGGSVTGGGTFTHGENVTLQATPADGYYFTNWSEGGLSVSTDSSYTFTADKDRTLTAHFSMQAHTINLSAAPAGGGSVEGGGTYAHGASVTVTASPNVGYHFENWTEGGSVVSNDSSYTFTATSDRNLVANFALNQYQVLVSAIPAAGGTVSGGGTYSHGSTVTISAAPATGYTFVNWTENAEVVSTDPDFIFTIVW
jgi:PKD repeat protein